MSKQLDTEQINFQLINCHKLDIINDSCEIRDIFLSPYSPFVLILFKTKKQIIVKKLYKYQKGILIDISSPDYIREEKLLSAYSLYICFFMRNTQEFLLLGDWGLEQFRIEQNQWKIVQTINDFRFYTATLSKDDQTLFVGNGKYVQIFQKNQNEFWRQVYSIKIGSNIGSIGASQNCIACISWNSLYYLKILNKDQKIKCLTICKFKRYFDDNIIKLTQKGLLQAQNQSVHWNFWSNKIIRKYLHDFTNITPLNFLFYHKIENDVLCTIQQKNDFLIAKQINGSFIVKQKLQNKQFKQMLIGNNGSLMICLDDIKYYFYENF